ncbi:unnamed protein product [Cylicocyclus nassatus]|uniref:Uncharacterized protein n=1 Tax=Cylicocyclus nassatus TaxID=53992 RepID=A0AA36GM55_CYLNA|nr:unnamed protein product [Cylicocyclus nassatus]
MRRLVLVLFLTAVTYAELTSSEITKHARAIFNDCTTCRIMSALKERPQTLKEVKSGIAVLPPVMRPPAVQAFQQWTNHILEGPAADCRPVCEKANLNAAACEALSAMAEHANEHTDTLQIVSKRLCKDDKSCLKKELSNNQLIMTVVKDFIHLLASMVDPQKTCGIEAPIKRNHGISLYTNKEFLNCQLCYSFLQFINTAFIGGATETSKAVLNAIGKAGEDVCKILDLPALLHLLVPGLGQLKCEDMPAVIILAFQYVIAPLFGAKAGQTCTRFYPYCSDDLEALIHFRRLDGPSQLLQRAQNSIRLQWKFHVQLCGRVVLPSNCAADATNSF